MKKAYGFIWILFSLILFWACQDTKKVEQAEAPSDWLLLKTPITTSLRGLSPLTEDIVWASGSEGSWMLTLDGGKTWQHGVIDGLDTVDFRDIEAFDAVTAVAISAGQPAVIYKTSDAGKSWQKTFQGPSEAFLNGLFFWMTRKDMLMVTQ